MQEAYPRPGGPGARIGWPALRQDLSLYPGAADTSGAPTWTLHDPVRNLYFSIDWIAFEILSRLPLGSIDAVLSAMRNETTLQHLTERDIAAVLRFIEDNELSQRLDSESAGALRAKYKSREVSFWKRLVHNYLFFRVPLFRADRPLERLLPHLRFLWSGFFLRLTVVAFLAGVWGVFRQWDSFATTLVDTFSWEGLLGFAGALIAVKTVHELGHGLTAKRFGCRVPYMGIAFLVMWPMAYTDVTESWKLNSHRKRLIIAGAGIMTELVVAAWALVIWSVAPEGPLRSVAFFLATTSLVTTLAINASPFMRFDGYFLLCDFLGMPNLHERSFAYTRWWLREKLFHLGDTAPEIFSKDKKLFIVIFSAAVWFYRLVLFLGIAILVYEFFFKILGIVLFVIEIWYFIASPVWRELMYWRSRWSEIGPVIRRRPAFYLGLIGFLLLVVPYDVTINSQGLSKSEQMLRVVTFQPSQVLSIPPPVGTVVGAGLEIMSLESPELEHRIRKVKAKLNSLQRQYGAAGFEPETIRQQSIFKEQMLSVQEEYEGLLAERNRLRPIAPFQGRIVDVDPDLSQGAWLPKGAHILTMIDDRDWVIDAYVLESDLARLDIGHIARFVPEGMGLNAAWGRVVSIDRDATRVLIDGPVASSAGGQILVRQQKDRMVPERSIYRVRVKLDRRPGSSEIGVLRGNVLILGYPKSFLGDLMRGITATLVREATF